MSDSTRRQPLIQSVMRAISVLNCFNSSPELGLTEISRMVGLHKSTAAGIINTLKSENFLVQDEKSGKLRLGLALFSLAVQARRGISEICEPYLNTLLDVTGETVNLAVLDNTEIVYIAKKESKHSNRISTSVGARLPVYCTAMGKSILAAMDRKRANALIDSIDLQPRTSNTITEKKKLLDIIDSISRDGIAYDFEEFETGIICIATPLCYKENDPVGAISVSGPSVRLDEATRMNISKIIKDIAAQICNELVRLA